MKNYFKFTICSVIVSVSLLVSNCSKKSSDPTPTTPTSTPTAKKSYEGKWSVSNYGSARVNFTPKNQTIVSFEFNKNSYLVIFADSSFKAGDFTATNDTLLDLTQFGVLKIKNFNKSNFNFDFTPIGTTEVITGKSEIIAAPITDSKSKMMSYTWKLNNIISDDTALANSIKSLFTDATYYATFSQYGTYLIRKVGKINGINTDTTEINTWKWSDNTFTKFCYGDWTENKDASCTGKNSVNVLVSDNNSLLYLTESRTDTIPTVVNNQIVQSIKTRTIKYELVVQ